MKHSPKSQSSTPAQRFRSHQRGLGIISGLIVLFTVVLLGFFAGAIFYGGISTSSPASPSANTSDYNLLSADPPPVPKRGDRTDLHDVTTVEHLIVEYANAERIDYGSEAVIVNSDLANISRYHSYDMAKKDYFSHVSPNGSGLGDRLERYNFECGYIAENIATLTYKKKTISDYGEGDINITTKKQLAKRFVGRWMKSNGHRYALLNGRYDTVGVGVYAQNDNTIYATMMLCDRSNPANNGADAAIQGNETAPIATPGADYDRSYWEPYGNGPPPSGEEPYPTPS